MQEIVQLIIFDRLELSNDCLRLWLVKEHFVLLIVKALQSLHSILTTVKDPLWLLVLFHSHRIDTEKSSVPPSR